MPKKPPDKEKFAATLQVRLTETEKAILQQRAEAAGLSMGAFVRSSIINPEQKFTRHINPDRKMFNVEIRRISINLSELARWANENKSLADAAIVLFELSKIEAAIKTLQSQVNAEMSGTFDNLDSGEEVDGLC